ncbi:MAG: 3D domain-containing protein [Clostridium sp.]
MKKTSILKTTLLMISLFIFHATPVFASEGTIGNLDIFNESQICGWVYEASNVTSIPEVQIKITDSTTGALVKEVSTMPTYQRMDLIPHVGEHVTPGFTASANLADLPDGSYSAAAYRNGTRFTEPIYYHKGNSVTGANGMTARSLGTFRLTAYCPCRSCSEGWGKHTSSGAIAASSHTVAVDKRIIPMGSKLLINGVVYTAEDIGGAVKGKHIDIFFDTHDQTRQFGSRTAEVYLLQ